MMPDYRRRLRRLRSCLFSRVTARQVSGFRLAGARSRTRMALGVMALGPDRASPSRPS